MYILLSFILLVNMLMPSFAFADNFVNSVQTTITARVITDDAKTDLANFRFALYKVGDEDTLISEVNSDKNGLITFSPVTFDSPGEYKFKILQCDMTDKNVDYDKSAKFVTVRLTAEDFKEIKPNIKYNGTAPLG